MTLLIDTNIFLEILLGQAKAAEAREFIEQAEEPLFISDYSLHSIGIVLFRQKRPEQFWLFAQDMILSGNAEIITLPAEQIEAIAQATQQFGLDFDDAYQYALAEYFSLSIISFDSDFDRTARGRKTLPL